MLVIGARGAEVLSELVANDFAELLKARGEIRLPCAADAAACEPVPAGIQQLLDLGKELAEQQQLESPACPPP